MVEQAETQIYEFSSEELAQRGFKLDLLSLLWKRGVIDELTRLRLEVAIQEAVTNGLEHGNLELVSGWKDVVDKSGVDKYSLEKSARLRDSRYAQRRVYVNAEFNGQCLIVSVRDEGNGFQPSPQIASDGSLAPYGRGLQMITNSVDEVRFEKGGREIVMVKHFSQNG